MADTSPSSQCAEPAPQSATTKTDSASRPSPMKLRDITVLLQHLQFTTNPVMKGVKLLASSYNDPDLHKFFAAMEPMYYEQWSQEMLHTSTKLRRINSRNPTTATAPNFLLDPLTAKQVEAGMKELTADDLEEIWLQIHAGNNCFPAADLLRRFVGLCDSEQEFEIQESNKNLVLVKASSLKIFRMNLQNFKRHLVTKIEPQGYPSHTGYAPMYPDPGFPNRRLIRTEKHVFGAFYHSNSPEPPEVKFSTSPYYIWDITMAQYGPGGKGVNGETFVLARKEDYREKVGKMCKIASIENATGELVDECICAELRESGSETKECNHMKMIRLQECAEEAMRIWEARGDKMWCSYCGKPEGDEELLRCLGCSSRDVGWCTEHHRELGMKFHSKVCGGSQPN